MRTLLYTFLAMALAASANAEEPKPLDTTLPIEEQAAVILKGDPKLILNTNMKVGCAGVLHTAHRQYRTMPTTTGGSGPSRYTRLFAGFQYRPAILEVVTITGDREAICTLAEPDRDYFEFVVSGVPTAGKVTGSTFQTLGLWRVSGTKDRLGTRMFVLEHYAPDDLTAAIAKAKEDAEAKVKDEEKRQREKQLEAERLQAEWENKRMESQRRKQEADIKARTRTWSDKSGKFKCEAKFLFVVKDVVHLERTRDGKKLKVPVVSLSSACQQWIKDEGWKN